MNLPITLPCLVFMSVIAADMSYTGDKPRTPKKHIMSEEARESLSAVSPSGSPALLGGITWVLVDTMGNAYGMLSNRVDPLAYDPVSGHVGLIHRGKTSYAAASGQLWYNTTPDGIVWYRIAALNDCAPHLARYPGATMASGLFAWSAPQLNVGAFESVVYGFDLLGAGTPFCIEDQGGPFWSNTRNTAAGDTPGWWWAMSYNPNVLNAANAAVHLWGTSDYGSIFQTDIWDLSLFQTRGLEIGLCYRNGMLYLGGYASLVGDPNEVMNVFYSKSSDGGVTWTEPDGPYAGTGDWRELPAITASPYDDWETQFAFDLLVDVEGFVHIFGVLEDTDGPDANLAVVEIFETQAGWDARFVSENLAASTITMYGAVDQMGYHVSASINADGTAMATAWLSAAEPGDTLPDIWISTRHFSFDSWSEPINITNTPDYAELLVQVAPILRSDGGDVYSMFLARAYEQGSTVYPPNDVNPADIFCAAASLTITSTSVPETPQLPPTPELSQNYPNPFNPSTTIRFSIPKSGEVSLRIFNLLGQEVATLVSGLKDAGIHTVEWDATGQPSGMYFYRLMAEEFVETRKLVLVR